MKIDTVVDFQPVPHNTVLLPEIITRAANVFNPGLKLVPKKYKFTSVWVMFAGFLAARLSIVFTI